MRRTNMETSFPRCRWTRCRVDVGTCTARKIPGAIPGPDRSDLRRCPPGQPPRRDRARPDLPVPVVRVRAVHVLRGLRQALVMLAASVAVALAGAGVWAAVNDGGFRVPFAVALMVIGGVLCLTGGTVVARAESNEVFAFLGRGPDREVTGRERRISPPSASSSSSRCRCSSPGWCSSARADARDRSGARAPTSGEQPGPPWRPPSRRSRTGPRRAGRATRSAGPGRARR